MKPCVLYFAPGSGLGHLNRALAICLALRENGCSAEIVTNSPFAEGLARAARFPITHIPNESWRESASHYLHERRPRVAVTDTFPFGLRGEWLSRPVSTPMVYLARRLRMENYRAALPRQLVWSGFASVVVAEPLSIDHEEAICEGGAPVVRVAGPIRLAAGSIDTAIPRELDRRLDSGRLWLVVHGGPTEEVARLCRAARERMNGNAVLSIVAPWPSDGSSYFEYFPAGNLLARCAHVISGAGYNMMADMMDLRAFHTAVPFERRFDDQTARLASWGETAGDGTSEAAQAIAAAAER